jgi:acetyl-CoA acetyltransferase
MPQTAQNVAEVYGLTRAELDKFSAASHVKTHAAQEAGIYRDEIVALEVEDPLYDDQGNWLEPSADRRSRSTRMNACGPERRPRSSPRCRCSKA